MARCTAVRKVPVGSGDVDHWVRCELDAVHFGLHKAACGVINEVVQWSEYGKVTYFVRPIWQVPPLDLGKIIAAKYN